MQQQGPLQQAARANDWGQTALRAFGSGMAAGATSALAHGNLSRTTLKQVGLDALSSTLGNSIADAMSASGTPEGLRGRDIDSLKRMDRLVRHLERDPASLSQGDWDTVARAADTSGPLGSWLSQDALRERTREFLTLGLNEHQVDDAMQLYARAGLVDGYYGTVGAVESVFAMPDAMTSAAVMPSVAMDTAPRSWLGESLDQGLIGVGFAGRMIAEQIDDKPWLKAAAVGLEVVAGPVKFALNQAVQHSFVGDLLNEATEAIAGYVGNQLSQVGHVERDASDGGIGALALGSLAAMGPLAVVKKIGGISTAIPINGATRTTPLGFESDGQFNRAVNDLHSALRTSGIDDAVIGVRGSSVTGSSFKTGTPFNSKSDIDFFIESAKLTDAYRTSPNIPGFVHPKPILRDHPALQDWSSRWQTELGRKVTPGGFVPGSIPDHPAIIVRP